MMDLFVLHSGKQNASMEVSIKSFHGILLHKVHFLVNINEINETEKLSDWYFVLYDDEILSPELKGAMPVFIGMDTFAVLAAYKKDNDNVVTRAPRLFRSNVRLKKDCLQVARFSGVSEIMLNGWIYAQDNC